MTEPCLYDRDAEDAFARSAHEDDKHARDEDEARFRLTQSMMIEDAIGELEDVELYWLYNALAVMFEHLRDHGEVEPHHVNCVADRLLPGMLRAMKAGGAKRYSEDPL